MTAGRRWAIVALGVLLLVASPFLVRAVPATDTDESARDLLCRIRDSRDQSFSALVETRGGVALPENDALSGLAPLLGEDQRVRVWWRDPATWRTSTLRATGETDLVHEADRMVRWVYESKAATLTRDAAVRLPLTVDVLPHELARQVLAGAQDRELSRLPARRVAGRDALGLRLVPAQPQAAVGRVDVWADRRSGLPLRVEVFARTGDTPVLASEVVDLALGPPDAAALRFDPPADADLRFDGVMDLAAAADRFAFRVPPRTLAGLPARRSGLGARRDVERVGGRGWPVPQRLRTANRSVGVYGRGPTVLLAIPLWERGADRLREDLTGAPNVLDLRSGLLVGAPPVRLLLAPSEPDGTSWLLAGTVTRRTLTRAAADLADSGSGWRVD